MLRIRKLVILLLLLMTIMYGCFNFSEPKLNIMVVAGGHAFDTTEFVNMFSSFPKYKFDTVMQPGANKLIASGNVDQYDVIVFYDMWTDLDSAAKAGYYRLLDRGKGMVFLHHSLASYQHWDEFKDITGGKFITEVQNGDSSIISTFKDDLDLDIKITRNDHPATRYVKDFKIHDEGYDNIWMKSGDMILLTTKHDDCSEDIAWVNTYGNSMIVYLMLGHDKNAFTNESYRRLLSNAIVFVNKQK